MTFLQHRRAIAVNSEQFARTAGAVPLLLTLLRDVSTSASADAFHVKYLALQIMYTLLLVNAALSQQVCETAAPLSSKMATQIMYPTMPVCRPFFPVLQHFLIYLTCWMRSRYCAIKL